MFEPDAQRYNSGHCSEKNFNELTASWLSPILSKIISVLALSVLLMNSNVILENIHCGFNERLNRLTNLGCSKKSK